MKPISCIICAFNEGPRIGAVLQAVAGHPLVSEVIVVDDGSGDDTARVAGGFPGVKLISYRPNRGKTRALMAGVEAAQGELIMMIDADLVGLTADAITRLVQPALAGEAEMTISLRQNSLGIFRRIGLDFVSGERVVPKSVFADRAAIEKLPPFGIESYINRQIIARGRPVRVVRWDTVSHTRKMQKMGWWHGKWGELKTTFDVLKVLSPLEVWRQNQALLRLSCKPDGSR